MDGRSCQEHTIPLTKFATSLFDDVAMSRDSVKLFIFSSFLILNEIDTLTSDVISSRVEI